MTIRIAAVCTLLFTGVLGECPASWLRAGDYCYWISLPPVSFEDAQGLCAAKESMLISLSTSLDLNATMAVLQSSTGVVQTWTGLLFDPAMQAWTWLDRSPYTNSVPWWGGREPSLHSTITEACAVLDAGSGLLHRIACSQQAATVCRRSAYKRELCQEDDGWKAIGNACYKTFQDSQTWMDAYRTCRDNSAKLLQLPFNNALKAVIQQSVVCDTSDNDVWITSPNITALLSSETALSSSAQCNYVSVMYNQILVSGACLEERKFICMKQKGSCAEGWLSHEGRCYKSVAQRRPWLSAVMACHDQGADIVIISSEMEHQFITRQMIAGTFPSKMWLGFSDQANDGQLIWNDGSHLLANSTHWQQGYPVNTSHLDCGIIQLGTDQVYWIDGYCYQSLPYVCEMSLGDPIQNKTNANTCVPGWQYEGTVCYKVGTNKNYTEAHDFCITSGGALASIHTPQDQAALAAIVPDVSKAWIGLRREGISQQFVWDDDGTTPGTQANWLPGEPNNHGNGEDCVQIVGDMYSDYTGAWNDNDCNLRSEFICQRPLSPSSTTQQPATLVTAPWSARCGEGWLLSSTLSACYLLVADVVVPWGAAHAQCHRRGGDLVSISSSREQTQVEVMVRTAGLAEGGGAWSGVWIGATDNTREGGWEWSDSAPFRYLHWSAGQPDNRGWGGEEQDCAVAVPASTLTWDDRDCGELHNYICKKPATPLTTIAPVSGRTTLPATQCQDWALLSGDYSVTDSMLVASSFNDLNHGPAMSRIFPGNAGTWMSNMGDTQPWIGVHFETLVTVKGVTTTGGLGLGSWTTQYKLQYRYDSTAPLYWYSDPPGGMPTVLTGNNDTNTPVTNKLTLPFAARQVYLYPVKWTGHTVALRWEILGCLEDECSPQYAVSGPLVVPNDNITASSVSDITHGASSTRLHPIALGMQLSCWRSNVLDTSQWIQVDFERVEVLRGISTRGNPKAPEWVSSYLVFYHPEGNGYDDITMKPYEEPFGSVRVFTGNVDNNTTVTNYLKSHIPSKRVRLQPQFWNGHIALQFDVLVCEPGCQEQPLLRDVSDEQLTATSSHSHHGPESSHLTTGPFEGSSENGGGWEAEFANTDQYIQVSLNVPMEVRAVATQGRHGSRDWVSSYYLSSSLDTRTWINYTNGDNIVVFSGNYDVDTVRKHYLVPFQAQHVRLHPTSWNGSIGLRWELYGCPGKNAIHEIGCFTDHPDNRDLPYEPYTDPLDGMDPYLCSRHCFGKGYYYAGLQARNQCYCGNSYGRYGLSPDCNLKCFPQMQFICGGLAANFVYSTGLTSAFNVCPPGWREIGQQCYTFNVGPSNWTTARTTCRHWHGDLVSVADRNVNTFLLSLLGDFPDQQLAWIGLNDLREDRYYDWSNLEDVVYTNWDLHEPAPEVSGDHKHCVAMNNQTGGWVVQNCARKLSYMCVTAPRPSQTPSEVDTPEGCKQGMFAYTSSCYVIVEENRTKSAAQDVCSSFNGHLVSIMNRYEQAFLTSLLSGHDGLYWTDVTDLHDPGRFTYGQGQHDVTYTNWDSNMPDSRRLGHCVAMAGGRQGGLWINQKCSSSLKAICKLTRDGFPEPLIPPNRHPSVCKTNWISSNSSLCYQVNNVAVNQQRTWAEARKDCHDQRGELASFVDSLVMQSFWRQKLLGSSNHFWIGLHALSSGVLEWSDSTAVNVDGPWASGQPDNRNGTYNCVELHVITGTLALRDCSLHRNWLCAIRQDVTPSQRLKDRIMPTAGPAGSCIPLDDTWKRYRGSCYKVGTRPSTWRQARAACQQDGADLASITGIQEDIFIYSLAQKTSQLNVWIGLSELKSAAGYYGWSDGSAVNFVDWDGNGPDDANGQESCAEMFVRTGKWNDQHCAVTQGYVCKRNMIPVVTPTPTQYPPNSGGCNDGWTVFETRCYLLQGQQHPRTWQEAVQDCKSRTTPMARVSIASVRNARENAFLTIQLYNAGMQGWVGLHWVDHKYLWVDNEDLTYTNWDIGEPNGDEQNGCVHLYGQGGNAGRWNDADCSRHMGWICESSRFPYWNVPTPTPSHCPAGFQRLGTSCYWFSNATHLHWEDAENSCLARNAHLVTISSQVEQDFVYLAITGGDPLYYSPPSKNLTYPAAWLGLHDSKVGGATKWTWVDGWPVSFTNWAPGESLDANDTDHCAAMNSNGTWQSLNCSVSRPFVCKITSEHPPYTPDPNQGVCDGHQWVGYGSQCYSFYLSERVSFAHASFSCDLLGASLVSIHSSAQNTFLQVNVKAKSALPVWIGLKRSDNGRFAWLDRSGVGYLLWADSQPRNTTEDGTTLNCGQLSPWDGRWLNEECSATYGYICMKNKVSETTPMPQIQQLRQHPAPAVDRIRVRPLSDSATQNAVLTFGRTHKNPATQMAKKSGLTSTVKSSVTAQVAVDNGRMTLKAARESGTTLKNFVADSVATYMEKQTVTGGSSSGLNSGIIAGIVVASVGMLVLIAVITLLLRRRQRDHSVEDTTRALYAEAELENHVS